MEFLLSITVFIFDLLHAINYLRQNIRTREGITGFIYKRKQIQNRNESIRMRSHNLDLATNAQQSAKQISHSLNHQISTIPIFN